MPKVRFATKASVCAMALPFASALAHASIVQPHPKFDVLYTFAGGAADGAYPVGGVVRDASGNLYGTTYWGGNHSCNYGNGCGTVFKIDPSGKETVLHRFSGGSDGANSTGPLILDARGNLFGTTSFGGDDFHCGIFGYWGCGVVFKMDQAGNETVLYTFKGRRDGGWPVYVKLLADSAGNLYGTTGIGGDLTCSPTSGWGCGVVFRIGADGVYSVLYRFKGKGSDGYYPEGGLVPDARGNLFGKTVYGGAGGQGTVFELAPSGREKVLHGFTGGADGGYPTGGEFVINSNGDLFGTASQGGNLSTCSGAGCGVVFTMSSRGKEDTLYEFQNGMGGSTDGAFVRENVVMDPSGNIYGATQSGGSSGYGTIFALTSSPSGTSTETVLHNFSDGADGAGPTGANLILDSRGNLYGVAEHGGMSCSQTSDGCGVVFRLRP